MEVIFDLHALQKQIKELETQSAQQEFWDDPATANKVLQRLSRLKDVLTPFAELEKTERDIAELYEMLKLEPDASLESEADSMALKLVEDLNAYELRTLLTGEHDAIVCSKSMPEPVEAKPVIGRQCSNGCIRDGQSVKDINAKSSAKRRVTSSATDPSKCRSLG